MPMWAKLEMAIFIRIIFKYFFLLEDKIHKFHYTLNLRKKDEHLNLWQYHTFVISIFWTNSFFFLLFSNQYFIGSLKDLKKEEDRCN